MDDLRAKLSEAERKNTASAAQIVSGEEGRRGGGEEGYSGKAPSRRT